MGSERHEHEDYEGEYAERYDNIRKLNAENEPEHHNNELSSIMDKQYGTRYGGIIWARKRKWDLPQKMQIHPTMTNEVNQSKIHHSNTMLQTIGNMRDYVLLHSTIHCGPNRQYNVMRDPLGTTILT